LYSARGVQSAALRPFVEAACANAALGAEERTLLYAVPLLHRLGAALDAELRPLLRGPRVFFFFARFGAGRSAARSASEAQLLLREEFSLACACALSNKMRHQQRASSVPQI